MIFENITLKKIENRKNKEVALNSHKARVVSRYKYQNILFNLVR